MQLISHSNPYLLVQMHLVFVAYEMLEKEHM